MDSSLVGAGCLIVLMVIACSALCAGMLRVTAPLVKQPYEVMVVNLDELKAQTAAKIAALSAPPEPEPAPEPEAEPEEMIALDEIETFDPSESEAAQRAEAMMLTMVRVTHEVNEILVRCGF